MAVDVVRKNAMTGKTVKFALGSKESLLKSDRIL